MRLLAAAVFLFAMTASAPAQEPPPPKAPVVVDRTAELQKAMTDLRGLKFTKPVTVGDYSKDELVAFIRRELDRELPKEDAAKIRAALVHFGLIPPELDFYQTIIDLLGAAVAGFYHPKTKELRLIKPGEGATEEDEVIDMGGIKFNQREMTLVHELCHAAQDQNFDLVTVPIELKTNDDVVLATQALIEGDATVVGFKWALKDKYDAFAGMISGSYKTGELGGNTGKVPAFLRMSLTFPYGYGSEFVTAVLGKAKDDWSAVSNAFADLPGSTEQILHPKKYFGEVRDYPQDIAIDGLEGIVGDGWKLTYHNVFGEFGTRLLLDEFKVQTAKTRRAAAEGWDGDRYFILTNDKGATAGVWMSVWDSEDDAKEFYTSYALVLDSKLEGAEKVVADQMTTYTRKDTVAILERRGAEVLVLDGFGAAVGSRANKIWSAAKKTEIRKVERVIPKDAPKNK